MRKKRILIKLLTTNDLMVSNKIINGIFFVDEKISTNYDLNFPKHFVHIYFSNCVHLLYDGSFIVAPERMCICCNQLINYPSNYLYLFKKDGSLKFGF